MCVHACAIYIIYRSYCFIRRAVFLTIITACVSVGTLGSVKHVYRLCLQTFPGGQITTSVLTFPQQYYVMSSHTNPGKQCLRSYRSYIIR